MRIVQRLERLQVRLFPANSPGYQLIKFFFTLVITPLRKIKNKIAFIGNLRLLKKTNLFDRAFYLEHNPDVEMQKIDPYTHFLLLGGFEGRDPGPNFNTWGYLATYSDVNESGINPLIHYLKYGAREGREALPSFETLINPSEFQKFRASLRSFNIGDTFPYTVTEEKLQEALNRFLADPQQRLCFPAHADPVVRIVIPTYNKAGLLYLCLSSILNSTNTEAPYRVCVVDNASQDLTGELLQRLDNADIIQNPDNRGFVEACNIGAAGVEPFILFLNNDTIPMPGWLNALVSTAQESAETGAVGAKLIYPTGLLQEAGGIIWNDGNGWNYGKAGFPDAPEYSYVREVDYCSGACLLVRRTAFDALGGFDARYAPAYYEDADLCFSLRGMGLKVIFQPSARVIHLEGATAGTNAGSGFKKYQEINRAKFVEKHGAALRDQYPSGLDSLFNARSRRRGRHILVVDHTVPTYDQDAGSVRMKAMLEILMDLGYTITFIPDSLAKSEPYTRTFQQMGVEVIYGRVSIKKYIKQNLRNFDLILLSRVSVAEKYYQEIVKTHPHPPVIFDTVDLHYLRLQRQAELENNPKVKELAAKVKKSELAVMRASERTWVVSDKEQELLAQEKIATVGIVPLIHAVRSDRLPGFDERRDILFVGGFQHLPNRDAVEFFLAEILPKVQQRLPEARFHIVGSKTPKNVFAAASDRIIVHGWVADLKPLYDSVRMTVSPLRFGAGMKGKIGESMANGIPVVTTTIGAEGMQLVDGVNCLIADSADEFAAKVIELYQDRELWETLARTGLAHIDRTLGVEALSRKIAQELAEVLEQNQARP